MNERDELARIVGRDTLPPRFERWHEELAPGAERATSGEEWAGALVLISRGRLEVECLAGGSRTFVAGDLLALGCLPLKSMRNAGADTVRLVAVRRLGNRPTDPWLTVRHAAR